MSVNAKSTSTPPKRPVIEWVVGGVSGTLVGLLILFLGYQAVFGDNRPPDLVVALERIEPLETGTLVAVTVANRGDQAAAEVMVQALRTDSPGAVQRAIQFDYVAGHAVRRGAFLFPGHLSRDDIHIEIGGYSEP